MNNLLDDRYDEAVKVCREKKRASISLIQRYLQIGYNRAKRIIEQMEGNGVVKSTDDGYALLAARAAGDADE